VVPLSGVAALQGGMKTNDVSARGLGEDPSAGHISPSTTVAEAKTLAGGAGRRTIGEKNECSKKKKMKKDGAVLEKKGRRLPVIPGLDLIGGSKTGRKYLALPKRSVLARLLDGISKEKTVPGVP